MIAYEGTEPYVFVSYSHKDKDYVTKIITKLKHKMCRVWFDEGLQAGESWNFNIANHILQCTQFIVFISPDSVNSKYVLSEINYAITNDKKIVPIMLKKTQLPASLDMMLGIIQFLDISICKNIDESIEKIMSIIIKSAFSVNTMPFLQDRGYLFYMDTQNVDRADTNIKNALTISCVNEKSESFEIFNLHRLGAYDTTYKLSSVEPITDYFYTGNIKGLYKISIKGYFCLEYPLYGPDADVLLVLILRIPHNSIPTLKLVDYQYINIVSSLNCLEFESPEVIGEEGWSKQIKEYLDKKLYN